MQVYSEDAEFGDAVASRGEAKRGTGKDFAADESTDVSSGTAHFLLIIALELIRSSCYYTLSVPVCWSSRGVLQYCILYL